MNHDPMRSLLEDASRVGRLDSEGAFTISGEAAVGKLATFQLPRKSAWILKIVQAAVRAGAPHLTIRQSNHATSFSFPLGESLEVEELKEAMLSSTLTGSPAAQHLAVGLRVAGFADKRAFTLSLDCGTTRTLFGWDGKQLVQRNEVLEESSTAQLHLGVSFPPGDLGRSMGGLMKSKGRATEEYQEVVSNCQACPIPLYFDGRRIDTLQGPHPDHSEGSNALLSVGWKPDLGTGLEAALRVPQGMIKSKPEKWRPTDKFTDSRVFLFDGDHRQSHTECLVKLHYGYKVIQHRSKHRSFEFQSLDRRSYVSWVKDGVVVERRANDWYRKQPVGFEVFLPANDLATDLSGFQIRKSHLTKQRVALAREQIRFQVENTLAALGEHIPKPFSLHTATYAAIGAVFTLVAPVTMGKGFIGAIAMFGLAISAYDKKKIMDDCAFHLRRLSDQLQFPG